jgi:predicted Zn-dependent protease
VQPGSVPLVQARLLSRTWISGLLAAVALLFLGMIAGGDMVADAAVNVTPYAHEREITQRSDQFRRMTANSLPALHPLTKRITAIGERLVQAIPGGTPYRYRFHVMPGSLVNAFALPGGEVFIYEGLIDLAGSEDAIAAALAHEIQHVEQRHGLRSVYRGLGRMTMFSMMLGIFGDDAPGLLSRVSVLKHSRALESEADILGLKLLHAAGIPKEGMVRLLNALASHDHDAPLWLSDHPDTRDRARAVAEVHLP